MNSTLDTLTDEQVRIVQHEGSAFVSACPGAGKTRVLVERARILLEDKSTGKGVAFLSFTNAAVSEFEERLRREGVLPSPPFPHFVGTFDGFVWQFLVAPFGVEGCEGTPCLIPDKGRLKVRLYPNGRWLPLSCFDPTTGLLIPEEARRRGIDPSKNPSLARAYEAAAARIREDRLARGQLDFHDVRAVAESRLKQEPFSSNLARALAARFREIIVDEAQDCNPKDLAIVRWLLHAGIATKIICDPHQAIYGFRGGVTDELEAFAQEFQPDACLSIRGNFRSSPAICKAVVAFRPRHARANPDHAVGKYRHVDTPVHILAYPGNAVPTSIGSWFRELVEHEGLEVSTCPVLAATWKSARKAAGQPIGGGRQDLTLRLAGAVSRFHGKFQTPQRIDALEDVHRVVLEIEGKLDGRTYHEYLRDENMEPGAWRPRILRIVRELDPTGFPDAAAWLERARGLLKECLPEDGPTIAQKLRSNQGLSAALSAAVSTGTPAMSIHAAKGQEFPGVCVVMTAATSKRILDYLETDTPPDAAEEVREIYVAASRAQRLLCFAIPKSQASRLEELLRETGTPVETHPWTEGNP